MSRNTQNDCWKNFILRRLFSSPPEALFQPLSLSNTPYPRADTNEASSAPPSLVRARTLQTIFIEKCLIAVTILTYLLDYHHIAECRQGSFACTLPALCMHSYGVSLWCESPRYSPTERGKLSHGRVFPAPRDNFFCTEG